MTSKADSAPRVSMKSLYERAIGQLRWQLNETLSALHESHIDHHIDGEGNPPGRGECELCDIWHDGVRLLKEGGS